MRSKVLSEWLGARTSLPTWPGASLANCVPPFWRLDRLEARSAGRIACPTFGYWYVTPLPLDSVELMIPTSIPEAVKVPYKLIPTERLPN